MWPCLCVCPSPGTYSHEAEVGDHPVPNRHLHNLDFTSDAALAFHLVCSTADDLHSVPNTVNVERQCATYIEVQRRAILTGNMDCTRGRGAADMFQTIVTATHNCSCSWRLGNSLGPY